MNEKEKEALQYRFSGYQLPLIKLDESGFAYVVLSPHPYYYNQPQYWQKPYWGGSFARRFPFAERSPITDGVTSATIQEEETFSLLPLLLLGVNS